MRRQKIKKQRCSIEGYIRRGETRNTSNVSSSSSICYPSVSARCLSFYIVYFTRIGMKLV